MDWIAVLSSRRYLDALVHSVGAHLSLQDRGRPLTKMRSLRLSLREFLLVLTCVALTVTIALNRFRTDKIYLHVYGTAVEKGHDRYGTDPTLTNGLDDWVRIASADVYTNQPFGFVTPNNRWPYIDIRGIVRRRWLGGYDLNVDFNLDDHNLTYICDEKRTLNLEEIVYIDQSFDCFLLSKNPDPYVALKSALKPTSPSN